MMTKSIKFYGLILAFFLLTGMKVVYKNDTGEIRAIGPFVDYHAPDGYSILDETSAVPEHIATHKVDHGKYRKKTAQELADEEAAKQAAQAAVAGKQQSALTKLRDLGLTNEELEVLGLKKEA